jgi:hypothetical protein
MEFMNVIRSLLPGSNVDGIQNVPQRLNKYSEAIVEAFGPNRGAEEGTRHVATNATLGTAVATTTSITAYDATKPIMLVQNRNGAAGKNIFLEYLRLIWGQVPTSATDWFWAMVVDSATRYASAGTLITPKNVNVGGDQSNALIYFGAPVTVAAGQNGRVVHLSAGRSVIPVINDEVVFRFGARGNEAPSTLGGTVALRLPIPCGPVILRPGDTWALHGWGTSNGAAPSWQFEMGFTER